ncbi:unnamed protein product [Arctogadus glacialis]
MKDVNQRLKIHFPDQLEQTSLQVMTRKYLSQNSTAGGRLLRYQLLSNHILVLTCREKQRLYSITCLSVPRLCCLSPVCQYQYCAFRHLSVSTETVLFITCLSVPRLCCLSPVCQYRDCAVYHLSVSTETVLPVNCLSVPRLCCPLPVRHY